MIIGQGPAPAWVWVSAPRVERIRTRLALTGLPLIGMALVFGIALVGVGLNLPTAHSPINVIGVMTAGIGAFWGILSGVSLATARSCARGEFVDVNGARLVRRLLGVWWLGAIVCAMAAWFCEVMTLNSVARPVPFTIGSAVYLAVLGLLVVLGGVAFFTARKVLRVG
ncbi:hypothetical protein [Lentzea albidocapillata]|uniref:Uncharacterized protein n=1 Tax=Lentzea albidocapillata TaxID=40571 RepID=A0A1W2F1K5_9PSEU|nr:hypothetical protein [Lentzea albidocapillata]SMD15843.1 hypothetical protein SAMN05660733_04929 [Lentzea albidocapillata]